MWFGCSKIVGSVQNNLFLFFLSKILVPPAGQSCPALPAQTGEAFVSSMCSHKVDQLLGAFVSKWMVPCQMLRHGSLRRIQCSPEVVTQSCAALLREGQGVLCGAHAAFLLQEGFSCCPIQAAEVPQWLGSGQLAAPSAPDT